MRNQTTQTSNTTELIAYEKLDFLDRKKWPKFMNKDEEYAFGETCARQFIEFTLSYLLEESISREDKEKTFFKTVPKLKNLFGDDSPCALGWANEVARFKLVKQKHEKIKATNS